MKTEYVPFIKEYGEPEGTPLVFFHGFPGSHLQGTVFKDHTKRFNLRVLAPDRPGYGYSDPLPGKGLIQFLDGLERALEKRGVEKFYLIGVSGGNPAALCMAARHGDRVLGLGSICGMTPYSETRDLFYKFARTGFDFAAKSPEFLMRTIINPFIKMANPEARLKEFAVKLNQADQEALKREWVLTTMKESLDLSRRQGASGFIFDLKAFSAAWPMQWSQITSPYYLWHGQEDLVLSHKMSEYAHSKVPHSKLKLYPKDGHYSLPIDRAGEILADLTGA